MTVPPVGARSRAPRPPRFAHLKWAALPFPAPAADVDQLHGREHVTLSAEVVAALPANALAAYTRMAALFVAGRAVDLAALATLWNGDTARAIGAVRVLDQLGLLIRTDVVDGVTA